jgi:hypothetical protein
MVHMPPEREMQTSSRELARLEDLAGLEDWFLLSFDNNPRGTKKCKQIGFPKGLGILNDYQVGM